MEMNRHYIIVVDRISIMQPLMVRGLGKLGINNMAAMSIFTKE